MADNYNTGDQPSASVHTHPSASTFIADTEGGITSDAQVRLTVVDILDLLIEQGLMEAS